jgi:hypothetical protein
MGAMATAVGFIALYCWVAEYHGIGAGLALVGAILILGLDSLSPQTLA